MITFAKEIKTKIDFLYFQRNYDDAIEAFPT